MARRNDHTRDQIKELAIDAAESILVSENISKLTARRIASKMNYTVGTIYLVFENLDDLIVHINARTLDLLKLRLENIISTHSNSMEKLKMLIKEYVAFAHDEKQRWITLYTYRKDDANNLPGWYLEKVSKLFELIEQQLANSVENKEQKNLQTRARSLWCSVHGICVLSVSGKLKATGISTPNEIVNHIVSLYINDCDRIKGH